MQVLNAIFFLYLFIFALIEFFKISILFNQSLIANCFGIFKNQQCVYNYTCIVKELQIRVELSIYFLLSISIEFEHGYKIISNFKSLILIVGCFSIIPHVLNHEEILFQTCLLGLFFFFYFSNTDS